jgi:hypothetical protein
MEDRIGQAARRALEARERAQNCIDSAARAEWLKLAAFWEALAQEYSARHESQDDSWSPDFREARHSPRA